MLVGAMGQAESSASGLDSGVDVLTYTGSNWYTAPSDGYLYVYVGSTSSGSLYITLNDDANNYIVVGSNPTIVNTCAFVKKGLKMQKRSSSSATGAFTAKFFPIV